MRGTSLLDLVEKLTAARERWRVMTVYDRFEHFVVMFLTALIALVIVAGVWHLAVKIFLTFILADSFDPTDYLVFQTVFGMIFTVIIALEFKRSLLVVAERRDSIVQVRTVILLAMLAIVRKLIILDLSNTDPLHLFALAAAIMARGAVHWLVREQDRRETQ
jgi:uncharacterized membrane protein (DUF373 family)